MPRVTNQRTTAPRAAASHLLISATFHFFVLASFYVLRPIREEISAEHSGKLAILQTCTFLGMLLAVPLYSALVARFPRRRFIPWTYRFFGASLLLFFAIWHVVPAEQRLWEEWGFFVWFSVYNLFIVSVFWSFMADLHGAEDAKRWFGIIAVGGTAGAIAGSSVLKQVIPRFGPESAFLAALLFLEGACWCARRLERRPPAEADASPAPPALDEPLGGGIFEGFRTVFRSPYLLMISLFIALQSLIGTFAYFVQARVVDRAIPDSDERQLLFANMDIAVNAITLVLQLLVVSHIMRRFGVKVALVVMPVVAILGFAALGLSPTLPVIVCLMVALRSCRYGMAKPAREVLFTVVPRAEKYKAKAFVDTVMFRGGDTVSGWAFQGLGRAGLALSGIAVLTVPVAAGWGFVARYLGRRQEALAKEQVESPRAGE